MSTLTRKEISEALREAMNREDLANRAAAQKLNLNPCYISMALNPNSWDSMGKAAWARLEEWVDTREALGQFEIPAGEEIWKPKEKIASSQTPRNDSPKPEIFTKTSVKRAEASVKREIKEHLKREKELSDNKSLSIPSSVDYVEKSVHEKLLSNANSEIARLEKEIAGLVCLTKVSPETETVRQKLAVDIEINLVINGQRVQIG